MRVKTFSGKTEEEAIELAKVDLGNSCTVLNIKKISKRGLMPFMNKSRFEVTAAVDGNNKTTNNKVVNNNEYKTDNSIKEIELKDKIIKEQEETIKDLQERINTSNELIGTLSRDIMEATNNNKERDKKYDHEVLQMIYNTLTNNNIIEPLADLLLQDLVMSPRVDDIDYCVKHVYKKLLDIIDVPNYIDTTNSTNTFTPILFMGPTGVGKTTTIAKLASKFILDHNLIVGLITADTFRIAAIEQLKSYADILNIEVNVVYNKSDIEKSYENMSRSKNFVFIDTAGRSHKTEEVVKDVKDFVETVPNLKKYLVLSLSTKVEDLIDIVNTYSKEFEFDLIFTKFDETDSYSSLLNVCYMTNKKVSYVSFGQKVPSDIKVVNPDEIAKSILGLGGK